MREAVLDASDAELRVYVVWFDAFEGDERSRVPVDLLADRRVAQFWDERKAAGRWYAAFTRPGDPEWVEWDAFFVYPPGATWDEAGARPLAWGRTVIGKREELLAALSPLFQ